MPRPGPRPYECIRRAWHSDSHQPLRGALIQEIFRVVNELHSTSTRRKKEWQEKLPIVVLRAEEILYSKANSESEYASVETLRTRLDDAVNTMIRREDGEEDGVYLAPCVEAALSLGCTPKKIPRGQRQVASRLIPNAARRTSANITSCRAVTGKSEGEIKNVDCIASTACGVMHDKPTSSTLNVLGPQNLSMQDQGLNSPLPTATASMFGVLGLPHGPYTPSPAANFTQSFPFPSPFFEAPQTVVTPSLPQLGGLVQFLKGADAGRHMAIRGPESVPVSSQMLLNVNLDRRALQFLDSLSSSECRTDVHITCRDMNGSSGNASTACSPPTSISRCPLEVGRDGFTEAMSSLGGVGALATVPAACISAQNSLSLPLDTRLTPQMQGFLAAQDSWHTCSVPKFGAHLSPSSCLRRDDASLSQGGSLTAVPTSTMEASSQGLPHDLQLRLGPPGKEVTNTSDICGGSSTTKRVKVDIGKLDVSLSTVDQFQISGRPFPQQDTWPRD